MVYAAFNGVLPARAVYHDAAPGAAFYSNFRPPPISPAMAFPSASEPPSRWAEMILSLPLPAITLRGDRERIVPGSAKGGQSSGKAFQMKNFSPPAKVKAPGKGRDTALTRL